MRKIAAHRRGAFRHVAPHNPMGPLATAVNLHFAAACPTSRSWNTRLPLGARPTSPTPTCRSTAISSCARPARLGRRDRRGCAGDGHATSTGSASSRSAATARWGTHERHRLSPAGRAPLPRRRGADLGRPPRPRLLRRHDRRPRPRRVRSTAQILRELRAARAALSRSASARAGACSSRCRAALMLLDPDTRRVRALRRGAGGARARPPQRRQDRAGRRVLGRLDGPATGARADRADVPRRRPRACREQDGDRGHHLERPRLDGRTAAP